jgi:protein-disulfide isomerase
MSKESLFFVVSSFLAIGLVGANIYRYLHIDHLPEQVTPLAIQAVLAQKLVGSEDALAKDHYLLVEFGDYECPPCRSTHTKLQEFVSSHSNVRLIFRQFPLTDIHPYAHQAALFAEAAREQGHFWEMHDFLFLHAGRVSEDDLSHFLQNRKIDQVRFQKSLATARIRVQRDIKLAEEIGVTGTPTLILRSPDGSFAKINLSALASRIR